eukprot:5884248-Alexandrium_andersonii.AAC.1
MNAIAIPVMANLFRARQEQERDQELKAETKKSLEAFCHGVRDMLNGTKLRTVFEVGDVGIIEQ